MPHIHVTAAKGTLNSTEQAALMSQLSNVVIAAEGAPVDDLGAQSLVWAYYDEKSAKGCYVGGQNLEQHPIIIAVTTPEGALTQNAKVALVENIATIVNDLVGEYDGRLNHWTMFHQVKEGSWAGGGQIFPLAAIQAAMNIKA